MGFSGNGYSTASTVITSEGDLRIGNSVGAAERLSIGSSGKLLKSNGTTASWQTVDTADSIITAQGQIIYGDASNDGAALSAGTSGYFLKTQGTSANPIWAAGASPTTEIDNATFDADFSTSAADLVDITDLVVTIGNITSGVTMLSCSMNVLKTTAGGLGFDLTDDTTSITKTERTYEASENKPIIITIPLAMSSNGSVIQARGSGYGGTLNVYGTDVSDKNSQMESISVG